MNAAFPLLALLFAASPQDPGFTQFGFCRDIPGAGEVSECLSLDAGGHGTFTIHEDRGEFTDPLELSRPAMARLARHLADTSYLEDASGYESGRRVANTGRKILTLEGPWGRREAAFTYSDRNEVISLLTFLDRLIAQEHLRMELESALSFDRLNLPALLEGLDTDRRQDRLVDPARFLDVLGRIASDSRVLNLARTSARELIGKIGED
jgi:hypothetical protein